MPTPAPTAARIDEQAIRALPKAEVHIHLEGTFSLHEMLVLAKESGVALPGPARTIFDISTHDDFSAPSVTTGGGTGAGSAGLTGFLRFLGSAWGNPPRRHEPGRNQLDGAHEAQRQREIEGLLQRPQKA